MGNIYRNAKEVLAWLGLAANDSDMLLEYLEKYYGGPRDRQSGCTREQVLDASNTDEESALGFFCQRAY
jgi:hypothetical protein